jgi:hypothetical protein
MTGKQDRGRPPGPEDVHRLCGDIADWKVSAILGVGGDITALEEAAAWASGADDAVPVEDASPGGPAARIHEILMAGDAFDEGV